LTDGLLPAIVGEPAIPGVPPTVGGFNELEGVDDPTVLRFRTESMIATAAAAFSRRLVLVVLELLAPLPPLLILLDKDDAVMVPGDFLADVLFCVLGGFSELPPLPLWCILPFSNPSDSEPAPPPPERHFEPASIFTA
jgi:hypothetical protein